MKKECKNCRNCEQDDRINGFDGNRPALNSAGRYLCSWNNPKKINYFGVNEVPPSGELSNPHGNCSYYKPTLLTKIKRAIRI